MYKRQIERRLYLRSGRRSHFRYQRQCLRRDRNCPEEPQHHPGPGCRLSLIHILLRECARRSYGGVVLDFDEPSREDRRRFAALLGQQCAKSRKFFCLPPSYAAAAEHPTVIVNTAISGGSFETHIREELARYGGGRNVVFDLQRLRMDFRLPALSLIHI